MSQDSTQNADISSKQKRPSQLGIITEDSRKAPVSTFGKHVKSTAFTSFRDSNDGFDGVHRRLVTSVCILYM